jgi:tetratricopeptide (TPR) repeat protein
MFDEKRRALIIGGAVLLLILMGLLAWFVLKSPGGTEGQIDPGSSKRNNIIVLAQDYLDQHEFQRALDLLDGLLIEDSADQEARTLRDKIIQAKKEYEDQQRLAELKQLEEQNQQLRNSLDDLGNSLQNQDGGADRTAEILAREQELRLQRQLEEARRAEEQRKEQDLQRKVESLVQQGEAALEDKDFDGAVDLARQALMLDPSSTRASSLKRKAEQARKDAESEAERKAREEKEKKINTLFEEGTSALKRGSWAEAEGKGQDIIALDNQDARGYTLAGQALYKGNPDSSAVRSKAKDNLKKAIQLDPSNWENLVTLGDIAAKDGNLREGIDYYKKATGLNSRDASLFYEMGKLQYRAEQFSEALVSFKKCECIDP